MDVGVVDQMERMLRRVVREELASLGLQPGSELLPKPAAVLPAQEFDRVHPYDLSDRELEQAERLLPEAERPILRQRVMAFRLEQKGNHAAASRMRRKADKLEQALRVA